MKNLLTALAAVAVFTISTVFADTLELADGTLLEGDFVGSSNGIVMFNTGDGIEAFPEAEVVGIFLSDGVATRAAALGALIGGNRSSTATGAAVGLGASILTSGSSINVPAGTILETRLRVAVTVPR